MISLYGLGFGVQQFVDHNQVLRRGGQHRCYRSIIETKIPHR